MKKNMLVFRVNFVSLLSRNCSVDVNITPAARAAVGAALDTISSPGGQGPFLLVTCVKVSPLGIERL